MKCYTFLFHRDVPLPPHRVSLSHIQLENIVHRPYIDDDDDDEPYNDIREFNPNVNTDSVENHSDMNNPRPAMETNFNGENGSVCTICTTVVKVIVHVHM